MTATSSISFHANLFAWKVTPRNIVPETPDIDEIVGEINSPLVVLMNDVIVHENPTRVS